LFPHIPEPRAITLGEFFAVDYEKDDILINLSYEKPRVGDDIVAEDMDAGSGADCCISESMIKKVKENISVPLIIGGGIRTPEAAVKCCKAGADIIVVGNAVEKNTKLISEISEAVHKI